MKTMTITITFEDGVMPEPVAFGDNVLGGSVTALAAYDLFHTMDIAEAAFTNSNDERCIEAAEKIEKYIVHGT